MEETHEKNPVPCSEASLRAKTFFESQEKEQVLPFDIGHINLRTPEAVFSLQDKCQSVNKSKYKVRIVALPELA